MIDVVQPVRDPDVAVAQSEQPQRTLDLEIARRRRCLHVPILLVDVKFPKCAEVSLVA